MSKLDLFFARRSVRKFTDQPVTREEIEQLLGAAMSAPSACAKNPWRFIVMQEKKRLQDVAEALPNGKFLANAPVGIIVCGDMNEAHAGELSYLLQDCSAAIENLLLAITASDLGACWLGVHPREDRIAHITRLFNLPANIIPIAVIALGHAAEKHTHRNRYKAKYVTWD